jgi:hypothetical protein
LGTGHNRGDNIKIIKQENSTLFKPIVEVLFLLISLTDRKFIKPFLTLLALCELTFNVVSCSSGWSPYTCTVVLSWVQILTTFNKLQIMSEVVLLLPNTDHLQQVTDYVRGCPTSTKYYHWWHVTTLELMQFWRQT